MGSDVKNMKDTVDTVSPFMKTTTEALQSLKQQFDAVKDQVTYEILYVYTHTFLKALSKAHQNESYDMFS
jgi:hypothetical protein